MTDQRVKMTSEVLTGIASVKACVWEAAFLRALGELRAAEHGSIAVSQGMKACTLALYFATPALTSLATFATYAGLGNTLTTAKVFSSIALLNLFRNQLASHFAKLMEFGPEVSGD